tara:strand:+ start:343 stop:546 length:204 start_codon:yes stop_codon:yes gene_type:complete
MKTITITILASTSQKFEIPNGMTDETTIKEWAQNKAGEVGFSDMMDWVSTTIEDEEVNRIGYWAHNE